MGTIWGGFLDEFEFLPPFKFWDTEKNSEHRMFETNVSAEFKFQFVLRKYTDTFNFS